MQIQNRDAFETALGERLLRNRRLEMPAFEQARRLQSEGGSLIELLPKLGLVAEREVAQAAAEVTGLALLAPKDFPSSALLDGKISSRFLRARRMIPIRSLRCSGDEGADLQNPVTLPEAPSITRYQVFFAGSAAFT